jgi:protein TonB
VAFETWSQKTTDVTRLKRLLVAGGAATAALLGVGVFLVVTSTQAAAEEEEDAKIVEVQLAKEPEPEPEPPPPPPPELKPHKANPGPRLQKLEVPTTISEEKVQEKEAKPAQAGGDPYEKGGGDGSTGQKTVVEAPTPAPPPPAPVLPKLNKPVPVSEGMTPPEPIVKLVKPEYPADAKAAGLEGTVVVRYIVNEKGEVTEVRAMKGPTELYAVCVAAVKAMRFSPALDADGKPIAVVRYMKFPFKLRT